MRLFLTAAVLRASSALAQFGDDYDDELQARDARDSVWQAAHGGKAPSYRGFEEMADSYPGHPMKSFDSRHHARDAEDGEILNYEDGFISNVARAVKGAYDHAGEAVKKAKAKAWDDDWPDRGNGRKTPGAQLGGKDNHYAGSGPGGAWRLHQRHVEDDADVDEADYDEDNFEGDDYDGNDYDGNDYDGNDYDGNDYDGNDYEGIDDGGDSPISARNVEDEEEVDWDFTIRDEDDVEAPQVAENDIEEDDEDVEDVAMGPDGEVDQLERWNGKDAKDDDPSATASDDDDKDLPDPKLELQQEFDEGIDEESNEPSLFERDAEPFNFFGFGKKDDHKAWKQSKKEAWKKGMKHVFARDGGLDLEDDSIDGAYDPIFEDPNIEDEDFYADAYADEDFNDELEKRAIPSAATSIKIRASVTKHRGDNTSKTKTKTARHSTQAKTGAHPARSKTKTGDHPNKTKSKENDHPNKTQIKASGRATPPAQANGNWGVWFGHW